MRVGVIDCGTNTFNLLVAEVAQDGTWKPIFSNKVAVKLAPSIEDGSIGKNRFARAIDALHAHRNNLTNLGVSHYQVFATSGIREASNGQDFVKSAQDLLGINVQVISANREAELIFKGVLQSFEATTDPILVMDIGGGSVEFIVGNSEGILWKESRMIGVSRLKGRLRPTDPLTSEQQIEIEEFIQAELAHATDEIRKHDVKVLIGASGSFDSLLEMLNQGTMMADRSSQIDVNQFGKLHQKFLPSTLEERLHMPGLIAMRADMIVLASMLINEIVVQPSIQSIQHSAYALKEGALAEMIDKELHLWNEN